MKEYGLGKINSFLLAVAVYVFIIILIFFRLVAHIQPAIQYTDI
ncbi:energy transducer TonB, partial [Campylobacter coli]|nr:energy transducer TonB [Campylobacter coli]